ncbi:MAG TPA: hypothetical protein VMZ71_06525, partial [Gemmataceae bacterium]|nr:hypothetical protein [Gemmataceae bacterium]
AGNPAQWYVRSFAEQRNFYFGKDAVQARRNALTVPLAKFPVKDLGYYSGSSSLRQPDYAARLDALDWQVIDRVKTEGLDATFPELQSFGILGEALHVRFRLELAQKKFDAAAATAKTMFTLARHLGEHPTVAANAVGMEIATRALDALEEFVQLPGSPNLYWALADLPTPLVDVRKGLQGHNARAETELTISDAEAMTDEQVEKVVSRLSGILGFAREQAGEAPRSLRAELRTRLDAENVKAVRKRLHAPGAPGDPLRGLAALPVAGFTPAHAVLLDEKRDFERRRDEAMKLLALPAWQIDALPIEKSAGLFDAFLPPVADARKSQAELEQRIALLRHVEAVRMHAAGHSGKLPVSLADVRLPLPHDPLTGKPFAYTLDGGAAKLANYTITIK